MFNSNKIQIIYQHVCGSKIIKPVKRINQNTANCKKHVLEDIIKEMPLFPIFLCFNLVLLYLNTKSDPHPGLGVLEPGH